ncbi:hypothetical protein [Burkholderia cenocepacia]|uniref:hypothetical protein n=1 Tax=Burkholderia cenocepacia TaxID=95486 RepID=UPI002AB65D13|nr:hypothetical protein [Burkholderia cenocepacia]
MNPLQRATDAIAPVAKFEFISLLALPYLVMAVLGLGCAFALVVLFTDAFHVDERDYKENDSDRGR